MGAATLLKSWPSSLRTKLGGRRIFLWTMRKSSTPSDWQLRRGEIAEAAKHGRVFELTPISA
jgi:hypothetical protein